MSRIILEGIVTDHWKCKETYPHSENIFMCVDMGGHFTEIFTDVNLIIKKRKVKNLYNVNLCLPKYVGVKRGQKIKVILED